MDQGGPRREFFRLLAQKAKESFFIGETSNFLLPNVPAVQVLRSIFELHLILSLP